MKKSNVIVSVICTVAIAMASIQYSAAAGGTSTTYNSNGIIEYDDNDDGTAEIVFDASDFERIDNVVTSGKNQIATDINTATGITVPQSNGTYSFSDISSVLQGINNNGSVSQTLNAGDTFTIPKGYHDGTGIITANGLAGQTPGTATDDKILQGYTAWVNGTKITGTIPSLGVKTYTPGTSDQTIASGQYLSGAQTIKGDSNLIAANIVSGKKIFGVTGTAVIEVDSAAHSVPTGKTAATAAQVLSGKYVWNGNSWLAGTMKDKSGSSTSATGISESTDKTQAIIKIPEAGYYDTNATLEVPIETIKNNVSSLNSSLSEIYSNLSGSHTIQYTHSNNNVSSVLIVLSVTSVKATNIIVSLNSSSGKSPILISETGFPDYNQCSGNKTVIYIIEIEDGDVLTATWNSNGEGNQGRCGFQIIALN